MQLPAWTLAFPGPDGAPDEMRKHPNVPPDCWGPWKGRCSPAAPASVAPASAANAASAMSARILPSVRSTGLRLATVAKPSGRGLFVGRSHI